MKKKSLFQASLKKSVVRGERQACFLGKVIYIGESQGQAIYVHVDEPRNPLAAPKSKFLDTEASRGNRKHIVWLICGLFRIQ